ncbi:TPR-like protein [Sporormia fimetaria CBS 119925]|uniref:TPR-like protein n=1 Tax=Sporormia fimetaria CBS 119925 TaxID=1340428 RepID=A0A6A6V2G2_9PLEO|nr:TPR-like protein [Sporormia fimetaria CBS 119925]
MQQYLLECGAKPSDYLDSVDAPLNQNLTTSLPDPELANSLPYRQTKARFYGRTTEMQQLRRALDPNDQHQTLRVMAIHGLGGVGKTQLALNYAHQSKNLYDAIAWIGADTNMRLVQSLAAFAFKLGLTKEGESEADIRCIQMVKDWLDNSGKSFLLIFDNVDNVDILSQIWSIWPTSSKGAVIITTRSPKVAASLTKTTMQLKPFEVDTAVDILYELTGFEPVDYEDTKAAKEICQQIGGLPLAMVQMSTFMRDRRCTYSDFLALYKKHPEKILARNRSQVDYDHTLNNVWDMSLQSLSKNARSLLELLSLFDPDSIPERLFVTFRGALVDARLAVLTDDFEFDSAISELSAESLIKRLASSESLSLHRLVKSTVLMRIPGDERTFYFDTTIWVLSHAFSNTWDSRGSEQSHGWQHWETCSAIVAHVSSLMTLQQQHNMTASNMDEFAKLIFRIGTYLWECEQPTAAKSFFDYGLSLDIDPNSRISAQAYRILGHIGLDLAQPRAALTAYHKALEVRKQIEEPNSPAIAEVYDSIACSYCEINDAPKALEYLAKSDEINFAHHGKTTGRTQAIYSLAYLRGGPPEKALESLLLCWKLQDKTQEEIAESKYPKHAGDIVLLARIKYAFGEKQEAKRLASRTISIRRGLYGTKGPRVADSTFLVALMLKAEGEYIGAAKMFEEIVNMSKDMVEMKGHLARALWLLAATEESMRNTAEAARLRAEANKERASIVGREAPDDDTEDAYMDLVPWMLW